jgi:hypothetical protein
MGGILLVPIHLDALWLETDLSVVEAKCDFTRLPYWDGEREVNPDVANISEELLSRPFHDRGLQLRAGVHLHWSLPDALCKGANDPGGAAATPRLNFPAVPNRWLVTRRGKDNEGKLRVERQWVVESDYLHPDAAANVQSGIAVPFPRDPANGRYRPYRHLGRQRLFDAQWAEDPAAESLTNSGYQLTAVGYEPRPGSVAGQTVRKIGGYGEPTFAAFYPNCLSVFGFHDPTHPAGMAGTEYEVLGWYSDLVLDCLQSDPFIQAVETVVKAKLAESGVGGRGQAYKAASREVLETAFKWQITEADNFPERTVCYARLDITAAEPPAAAMPAKAVTVAVGNTGTEALSAYLSVALGGGSLLEEQLEALHLNPGLEGKELDVGLKFKEARHEKGFMAVQGGTLWGIRQEVSAPPPSVDGGPGGREAAATAEVTLPEGLAHLLNQLNLRQQARDRAARELEAMRNQLFADWYKYMLCAHPPDDTRVDYPDVDEVRHFVEKNDLLPIKRLQARLKALDFQCGQSLSALSQAVSSFGRLSKKKYIIQSRPAPRYWRPSEPALLIVDETVEPTKRHGQDGLLECQVLAVGDTSVEKHFPAIRDAISARRADPRQERIGFGVWTEQPWNPFALEWSVELFPRQTQNNLDPKDRDYHPDFITTNYLLEEGAVDLTLRPGREEIEKAVSIYSGSSLLTPHAKLQLQKQIRSFLDKRPKPKPTEADPVRDALQKVAERLDAPGFHAMAQTLNGFNEALLMRKQTLQLPIADPLGFDDAAPFTEAVRDAVGNQNRTAPQPQDDFNPIRAGLLKILNLRLVDTFGRTQTLALKDERVHTTEVLRAPRAPHKISLPPRFTQAARLNFRWLAAAGGEAATADEPEMNAHPATTPVCGWLLPNNLDSSLMVYDNAGRALGSINQQCRWESAPGAPPVAVNKFKNSHLKTLVGHLLKRGQVFFGNFLTSLEVALENIDPESFAQHEAAALLVGRPVAVVRATLDLELLGRPAVNQDWNVFRLDLARDLKAEENPAAGPTPRDTDEFTKVLIPVRLGDDRQLNDGLVGYWKEVWTADGMTCTYENDRFYAHACDIARVLKTDLGDTPFDDAQKKVLVGLLRDGGGVVKRHSLLARLPDGDAVWQTLSDKGVIDPLGRDPHIRFAAAEPELFQAIDSPAQKVTMLVDPRGSVHASTGMLPTKAIHIPPDQYAEALRAMEVTFLSAPILTTRGKVNLPLPSEPGSAWSWLSHSGNVWVSTEIGPVNSQAIWSGEQEIQEGWLKLRKKDS